VRAIDTNIIVRFLTADHRGQARSARAVIEAGDIFIPTTVLLESEWVLRSGYGFAADRIAQSLQGLAGLPGVTVEEPPVLAQALHWMREGMDFADAIHLAKSGGCTAFLTFDRKLAKLAEDRSPVPVKTP
jgi:predicted nucleic-acid-binding protein